MKLRCDQVRFHPQSYADPSGRVFWWEGDLYRAIGDQRSAFYRDLFSRGIAEDLIQRKLLVHSELTNLELDGYGLVLRHRTIPFVSYCFEWCAEMLRAAAVLVLTLERELRAHGLTLQDAHPWNVLFDGPTPVWVDIGSIVPASNNPNWSAYEEFCAYFTRPLNVMAAGHERIARLMLRDERNGIQKSEAATILNSAAVPKLITSEAREKRFASIIAPIWQRTIFWKNANRFPSIGTSEEKTNNPATTLEATFDELERIRLPLRETEWSNYDSDFPEFNSTVDWSPKHHSLIKILLETKPKTILDVGCNRGWYSQLGARTGAHVVSFDTDEPSVTKLFRDASTHQLPILPLLMDFTSPSPGLGPGNEATGPAVKRLHCDMVMALALVHHLVFKQLMRFEQIVQGLSFFADRWLVVEFIAKEDRYVQEWWTSRFDWYSLDRFTSVLRTQYREITRFPSNEEHRWVLLCKK